MAILCTPNDLAKAAACFRCYDPQTDAAVKTYLLCQLVNAQGGTGQSCLLCGTVDPVAVPACDCAMYYNITGARFFYWDSVDAAWYPFLLLS